MSSWFRCVTCGWTWDDENPAHEVCTCFDRNGVRLSQRVQQWPVYSLDGLIVGVSNVPPAIPYHSMAHSRPERDTK